jgi:hypothetical protein
LLFPGSYKGGHFYMKIILYLPWTDGIGKRLFGMIEKLVVADEIEIFRTVDSLARRLKQPVFDLKITVLLTTTRQELSEILLIKDLFQDIRIILILPDGDSETLSMGHTLYPRFISYIDSDFEDVAVALSKMTGYMESQQKRQTDVSKHPLITND